MGYVQKQRGTFRVCYQDPHAVGAACRRPHDEVVGAWLVKVDNAIVGCLADEVPEVVSLGKTLNAWRREILADHTTGASNGPTEGLNPAWRSTRSR
jgi:hypothetical protein